MRATYTRPTSAACLTLLAALLITVPLLQAADEAALIGVLQSNQGPGEKDAACQQLKVMGTARAVPALAALLTDGELGFSARFALAAIPAPEASAALREALGRTEKQVKAGIIDSLGQRADKEAVPDLARLLKDGDADIAAAAACSLGRIGGKDALAALQAAAKDVTDAVRPALDDGMLACAERLAGDGDADGATAICNQLYDAKEPEHVRVGAYRLLVLSNAKDAGSLIVKALAGQDRAGWLAVLPLVRELPGEDATRTFASALKNASPAMQVSLLEALTQRGDVAALPAMLDLTPSENADVRQAAFDALGVLGNASVIPALTKAASNAKGEERKAAVQALIRLKGAEIAPALMKELAETDRGGKKVLLEVLRYRRDSSAVGGLKKLAESGEGDLREEAMKALAVTADGAFLSDAVALLVKAATDGERNAGVELVAACAKQVADVGARAKPVLAALKDAQGATRAALIATLPNVAGDDALAAARAALAQEGEIRMAAVRALSDWPDDSCFDDLLNVAKKSPAEAQGILALRGCLRLLSLPSKRSVQETIRLHQGVMSAAQRTEEKRLVLSSLGALGHADAAQAVEGYLTDAELKSEASAALVSIAEGLASTDSVVAKAAIEKALAANPSQQVKDKAGRILAVIERLQDHIVSWLVSGPYQADGQGPEQLFDVAFDPEKPDGKAKWRKLENATSTENPVIVDLQKALATENCVAYLRVEVVAPKAQDGILEIGSDDGVKVWVNGQLVHAVNVLRACQPGQEKVKVSLKEGTNALMLKITQGGMGWGACARFRLADGGRWPGLTIQAR